MKNNRLLKSGLIIISALIIIILIKQNITATKEKPKDPKESINTFNLEVNSELVQQIYSSLNILSNRLINDEIYRFTYFNINETDKLTPEQKLYIAFEKMYENDKFEKTEQDDTEILKASVDKVKNEIMEIFKDDSFDPTKVNYKSSLNCGIVDYLYTGQEYELKFKKCDDKEQFNISKLESATKDGNYIKLVIKSFYATKNKKGKYDIRNYNDDLVLSTEELDEVNEDLFNKVDIQKYIFSFELKGDNYYLTNVSTEK